MNCYTLNGQTVDFYKFLKANKIGQGLIAQDQLYQKLLKLSPGKSYTFKDQSVLAKKPYRGNLTKDMKRQLMLAHKPVLSDKDKKVMARLDTKISSYLRDGTPCLLKAREMRVQK